MSTYVPVVHGRPSERPDDADTVRTARLIAAALTRLGYRSDVHVLDLDFTRLEALADRRPYATFNLVEAIRGDGALAGAALAAMEHYRLRPTGAPADAYVLTTSKPLTKHVLEGAGIATPAHWPQASLGADDRVIVKAVSEDASLGIDQGSVVTAAEAAAAIAERERRFGVRFFAEQYVEGREFNVSLLAAAGGPQVLPLAEMRFDRLPAGRLPIVDYAAKWDVLGEHEEDLFVREFGVETREPALARAIAEAALASWRVTGLAGYARVDLRVDARGRALVIEVNANPCLAPDAGFSAALAEAGRAFDEAVGIIVEEAARRRTR